MTKTEIAETALRNAGRKRIHEDSLRYALVQLDLVLHAIAQDHLKVLPDPLCAELVEKLTKRLKR